MLRGGWVTLVSRWVIVNDPWKFLSQKGTNELRGLYGNVCKIRFSLKIMRLVMFLACLWNCFWKVEPQIQFCSVGQDKSQEISCSQISVTLLKPLLSPAFWKFVLGCMANIPHAHWKSSPTTCYELGALKQKTPGGWGVITGYNVPCVQPVTKQGYMWSQRGDADMAQIQSYAWNLQKQYNFFYRCFNPHIKKNKIKK